MRVIGTIVLCSITWQLSGCTRAEPSLVPLGHGPLSLAEQEREAGRSREEPRRAARVAPTPTPESDPFTVITSSKEDTLRNKSEPTDAGTAPDAQPPSTDAASKAATTSLEAWFGLYRGRDTTVFVMPEQSDRRFDDSKAKIRVESTARNQLTFALIDSSNEKDICKLMASVEGDTATINAGQSCFLDPDEDMSVKSRPGKATHQARHLTFDLVLDTVMTTEFGDARGSIEYHFDGDR
jgi:hypothetical protein